MSENDPANLLLSGAFYIRKYKPTSIPEKNVLNSQTFYCILETLLKRF